MPYRASFSLREKPLGTFVDKIFTYYLDNKIAII